MRAIILAAGRGSRLGQLTEAAPKCLVKLGEQTLLARQQAALRRAGVQEIAVVTGYRADMLRGDRWHTFHAPRWAETNMVRSLQTAAAWLSDSPCIVCYADIFFSAATIERLIDCEADLAIAYDPEWQRLWSARFTEPLADAESFRLGRDGALVEIGARATALEDVEGQYMGLLRFTPAAWRAVEELLAAQPASRVDKMDMTTLLQSLLRLGQPIRALPCIGPWGEVDSETDLQLYEGWLRSGRLVLDAMEPN